MIRPYLRYLFLGLAAMIVFAIVAAQAAVAQPQTFAYPSITTGETLYGETQAEEYEGSDTSDAISQAYLTDTILLQSDFSNAANDSTKASIDHIFPGVDRPQGTQLLGATSTDLSIIKVADFGTVVSCAKLPYPITVTNE